MSIVLRSSLFLGIDKTGEAVDIASEAGAERKKSVKPTHVWINAPHDKTNVKHREKCAGADHRPWSCAEEAVAAEGPSGCYLRLAGEGE